MQPPVSIPRPGGEGFGGRERGRMTVRVLEDVRLMRGGVRRTVLYCWNDRRLC